MNVEDFYRTLVQEAGDAIILCAAQGTIQFWNWSAERTFGYTRRDALGQSLDIIIPENLREPRWRGRTTYSASRQNVGNPTNKGFSDSEVGFRVVSGPSSP